MKNFLSPSLPRLTHLTRLPSSLHDWLCLPSPLSPTPLSPLLRPTCLPSSLPRLLPSHNPIPSSSPRRLSFLHLLPCLLVLLLPFSPAKAQEFPAGWVLYLEGAQGLNTDFKAAPDLYTAGLRLLPQYTVKKDLLRVGASAGLDFTGKKLFGTFGPSLACKLKTFSFSGLGSLANLQVYLEHLWGTNSQKLLGGGVRMEIGQLLVIGLGPYREYEYNSWWFRGILGINLLNLKHKPPPDPFTHP